MSQNRNCKNNVARHEEYFDCEKPLDDYPHHACSSWVWVKIDFHIKKEFGYTFEPWLGITVAYTHTCLQKSIKHLDLKRSASTTLGEASLTVYVCSQVSPLLTLVAPSKGANKMPTDICTCVLSIIDVLVPDLTKHGSRFIASIIEIYCLVML